MRKRLKLFSLILMACVAAVNAAAEDTRSTGTAFAVNDNGWLLTNAHVVKNCSRVEVKGLGFSDPPKIDEMNDLAALHILPDKPIKSLDFRSDPARLGEDIVALGFPLTGILSDSIKVTTGNVNALAGIANDTRYIQISTPIQPGNSGGPIVDKDGLLLGITSATLAKQFSDKIDITAQNVNFAIRSSVAEVFLQSQGINYQRRDASKGAGEFSTADLAEKAAQTVYPVVCHGSPVEEVKAPAPEANTSAKPVEVSPPSLINASGYDAIGFDYSTLRDTTYLSCKTACTDNNQCMAFTYNVHHHVCFLKSDVVAMIRNSDAVSAYSSLKANQIVFSTFTVYRDMDFPGGDYLKLSRSSYETCLLACLKDLGCRGFAYVRKKQQCWLKDVLGKAKAVKGVEFGMK